MQVEMSVRYNKTDIAALVMENHTKIYGAAPAGMVWGVYDMYSWECTIRAVDAPKPEEVKEQEQKAEI